MKKSLKTAVPESVRSEAKIPNIKITCQVGECGDVIVYPEQMTLLLHSTTGSMTNFTICPICRGEYHKDISEEIFRRLELAGCKIEKREEFSIPRKGL